ncbi:hypothetical protein GCM10007147_03350 [Nocardiopsis kunsanensis]|uniref:DUF4126 domain-containing protein n=2 Tax=Nocardiopsis kunsanensis TaxID=141693 RepID=A0A918X6V0_9ACTN|nr:hypothetical protein GCM10007147_03350 [Nocardiopsis kunsanensis]
MLMIRPSTAVRAAVLGLATGSRSSLGPCAPLWSRAHGRKGLLCSTVLAVAGELAMDKVPGMPGRTTGPVLALRVLSGAVGGGLLARGLGERVVPTAVIAALAVPASAAAGVGWRAGWSGPAHVDAVLEDTAALTLACLAVSGTRAAVS